MSTLFTIRSTALLIALTAFAIIAGAWFIELGLGVKPCPLCLEQRIPYYVGIPLALLTALLADRAPKLARILLALTGLAFLIGSGMGAYHTGVEYGLWKGPADCTGPIPTATGMDAFLKSLDTVRVIRCDEVAMRIVGLSLAAWNAIIAGAIATYAAMVVWRPSLMRQ
jgi:disulfide bond formation protein DsbB